MESTSTWSFTLMSCCCSSSSAPAYSLRTGEGGPELAPHRCPCRIAARDNFSVSVQHIAGGSRHGTRTSTMQGVHAGSGDSPHQRARRGTQACTPRWPMGFVSGAVCRSSKVTSRTTKVLVDPREKTRGERRARSWWTNGWTFEFRQKAGSCSPACKAGCLTDRTCLRESS